MIVKAVMAIVNAVSNIVFSLLPDIPILPAFIGEFLNLMGDTMTSGAGIIKFILGDAVYNAALDYIILLNGWKIFKGVFMFVKKYLLLK